MKLVKSLLWIGVALLGAVAYAFITRLVAPKETVNALWLVVASACTFCLAYRFYGRFIVTKVLALDANTITPAYRYRDGHDFDPTNKWVLFGHHFAAIAGAGPLIGPILAAQFGYLPGALWILIGSVLAGSVHDVVLLVASIRHDGHSLAEIARKEIGAIAGGTAAFALLFIIVVALSGLGLAVVNALTHSAWGTFTIASTIPIAFFMGFYLYKFRPGKITEATVTGVSLLIMAVILGHEIAGTWLEPIFTLSRTSLIIAMAIYGFIASVLPVWMLLCPRDYLSTYMKIATVLMLAIGILLLAPEIHMPAVTIFAKNGNGPVIPGDLFPFLFITIACGAISGFHSLIATGTTPKMIMNENDAYLIGFGAMLTEGFVSMMALIAGCILIPGDYFAINSMLGPDVLTTMGFAPQRVQELSAMVGTNVANRPGGAVSLAVGMASVFSALPGMKSLMAYWYNFALMFEALFILTTVDAGTRVARFLLQEAGGYVYAPLKRHSWMPGTLLCSAIIVGAWSLLIYSGSIDTIWPMFGVANQLLAVIALGVGTTILLKMKKRYYTLITVVPMVFMLCTTFTASYQLCLRFINTAKIKPELAATLYFDTTLIAVLAVVLVVILFDMIRCWIGISRTTGDELCVLDTEETKSQAL